MRPETITIGEGDVRRRHQETARDDHDVRLAPGTYPLRYLTVSFHPCDPEEAYWVCASIPATRENDGARFGKAGDAVSYHLQMQAYHVDEWGKP